MQTLIEGTQALVEAAQGALTADEAARYLGNVMEHFDRLRPVYWWLEHNQLRLAQMRADARVKSIRRKKGRHNR